MTKQEYLSLLQIYCDHINGVKKQDGEYLREVVVKGINQYIRETYPDKFINNKGTS